MKRFLVIAPLAAAALFAAAAAEAGQVNWSVGINVPPVATYVSGGPGYYPQPVYSPRPYYEPRRVYMEPSYVPVYPTQYDYGYQPRRVYVEPAPVYFPRPRVWLPPLPPLPRFEGWHHDHDHDRAGWRR